MPVQVEVWGDYACFSRPEFSVERVSYDVMTPSAARGILESIYWHNGVKWIVDSIAVCNPIRFTNIRRNEVKSKIPYRNAQRVMHGAKEPLYLNTKSDIQQRASMILRDVRYVITAHFEITEEANAGDNPGKVQDIMKRRLERGQCYMQPYLGCREFPAHFARHEGVIETCYKGEEKDLGYMLYDLDYSDPQNIQPFFFHAILKDGILDLRDQEVRR